MSTTIVHVEAREILDSRGHPTVEATVVLEDESYGEVGIDEDENIAIGLPGPGIAHRGDVTQLDMMHRRPMMPGHGRGVVRGRVVDHDDLVVRLQRVRRVMNRLNRARQVRRLVVRRDDEGDSVHDGSSVRFHDGKMNQKFNHSRCPKTLRSPDRS